MLKSKSTKIILFVILPILVAGVSFFYNFAGILFSAGPVTLGHKEFENSCLKCHALFTNMSGACLDCHEKMEKKIEAKNGFHGNMDSDKVKNCLFCHIDHKGNNFFIIKDARTEEELNSDIQNIWKKNKLEKDFKIHPVEEKYLSLWAKIPADFKWDDFSKKMDDSFDHDLTGYPLTGKHKKTKCSECHTSLKKFTVGEKEGMFPDFALSDLDRNNFCYTCHKKDDDSKKGHNGKYGKNCSQCHNIGGPTLGWKALRAKVKDHHEKPDHLLEGKHKKVKCQKCHEEIPFKKKEADQKCIACHEKLDKKYHENTLGKECKDCHTPESFRKSKFDHQKTKFILYFSHKDVKCQQCHPKWNEKNGEKKIFEKYSSMECFDCHKRDDVHRGAFKKDCKKCHRETSWDDVFEQ